MKLIGLRLMLWGGVAFMGIPVVVSLLSSFADSLGFIGGIISLLSPLGLLAVIAGAIIYFISLYREPASKSQAQLPEINRTRFWIGAFLAAAGFGFPAFIVYEMLFVPGNADAIFILMIFGPIGLFAVAAGIILIVRNRK